MRLGRRRLLLLGLLLRRFSCVMDDRVHSFVTSCHLCLMDRRRVVSGSCSMLNRLVVHCGNFVYRCIMVDRLGMVDGCGFDNW